METSRRRLTKIAALAAVGAVLALGLLDGRDASVGFPTASPAASPQELSAQLASNDAELRKAIDAWRAGGDPPATPPPADVAARAVYLQDAVRLLASQPRLAAVTVSLLPAALASEVGDLTVAARKLRKLSRGARQRRLRTGPPPPLSDLLGSYDAAQLRYGIGRNYLAAIHLVETKFGRVKSNSIAGAKGPMQFIPATWRIYGHGGNIQDPHDAILAAARLLRANGAPRSYARALHAYNPSKLYVKAVQRYAAVIASDPYAVYFLYCWTP